MSLRAGALFLALLLGLSRLAPAYLSGPESVSLSVKVGERAVRSDDFLLDQKNGYVHVLFNATPYLDSLPKGKDALAALVTQLLKSEALPQFPDAKLFKIDVADISARDDYGLPLWEKVRLIQRFTARPTKKGLMLKPVAAR